MNDFKKHVLTEDEEFDVKKLISGLLDNWKLYFICLVLCLACGVLFIRYSTPMYYAHAKVLVQDDQSKGSSSFLGSSAFAGFSNLLNMKSNVNDELEILRTRDLMEQVVQDVNLNISYFRKGRVRSVELYKSSPFSVQFIPLRDSIPAFTCNLNFSQLGADNSFQFASDELDTTFSANFNDTILTNYALILIERTGRPFEDAGYFFTYSPTNFVVKSITENLESEITNKETNVISLTFTSSVPGKGEDILQKLITGYINRNLSEKNKISDSTITFVNSRIDIVAAELNNIEANIQGFKQSNKIADISEQSKALISNSSIYYEKLNEVEVQLNVVNSVLATIQQDANNKRPVPSLLNTDPTFLGLVEKYNTILLQRDKLLLSTTEGNPLVTNLDIQLSNLRNDMIKSLQNQQKALQLSKDRIISENAILSNMVSNVPVQERKYVDLSREQSVKQALYLFLLQKKEETAITKASNIPNAAVIETPKSEYLPYFPQKSLVMGASLIIGLLIPAGFLLIREKLTTRITSKEDIQNATDCSILGEIGRYDKPGPLLMKDQGRSVVAEQFRILRTNMDFLTAQKTCPCILLTSSITGEGKSFIAAGLGQIYAFSGKKVLLIEMDLRKPKLSSMLEVANDYGFSNFIISGKHIREFIKPLQGNPNMFILSSGPVPPNPAEMLMKPEVADMFDYLKKQFDLIIIDSPPIGMVTDAQILCKYADVNLYVVRQGYTFKGSIEIVNDLTLNKKFPNLYLILNDVAKGTSYRYGYGYGYGYAYGYGYGTEEKKKKNRFKIFTNLFRK